MKKWRAFGAPILLIASAAFGGEVLTGIDVLEKNNFDVLQGKTVGLITNHTGVDREGRSTIDVLRRAPGVRLARIFAPEHGIRGKIAHGQVIADDRDILTGLPVISLYGPNKRPSAEMLEGLDALVYDIQDIGTRFYTYTTTLAYALEACRANNIELVVLDRPNPVTGSILEGEPLVPEIQKFTAYLNVPVRHGMTPGELARWHNRTKNLGAELTIVPLEGWRRDMWWEDTGLKFRKPSPNIRNVRAAALYPGVGSFEATNVSVGRGTRRPFEVFGAPWIDGEALARALTALHLPGFAFKSARFKPKTDLYPGETCQGVEVTLTDRDKARPVDLFIHAFWYLRQNYPDELKAPWDGLERVAGGGHLENKFDRQLSVGAILEEIHSGAETFRREREPDLLYE